MNNMRYSVKDVKDMLIAQENLIRNRELHDRNKNKLTAESLFKSIQDYHEAVPEELRTGEGKGVEFLLEKCENYLNTF